MPDPRIVVIGAGPTGLGAAYRLVELGYRNFIVLEADSEPGGLARSVRSAGGFHYDIGGHVLFSHYDYFDRLFDSLVGDRCRRLHREAWILFQDRLIPYPFQHHLRYLPGPILKECLDGLAARISTRVTGPWTDFEDFLVSAFGTGVARHFMLPYNRKVWARPPAELGTYWLGERVAPLVLADVVRQIAMGQDGAKWGPNAEFKYPMGGTGQLFLLLHQRVRQWVRLAAPVISVDPCRRELELPGGEAVPYDLVLSTMPIDRLIGCLNPAAPSDVIDRANRLRHTGTLVVGIGIAHPSPSTKNWIYFPDQTVPFHRVTYLSNYSDDMVPDPGRQYSLLAEVSYSQRLPGNLTSISDEVIDGLLRAGILPAAHREAILDTHVIDRPYTYPVPTTDRETLLPDIHQYLELQGIYSRGRFGAWRYEVGNMDHAVAQGVEWVDRMLLGQSAKELTWQGKRAC